MVINHGRPLADFTRRRFPLLPVERAFPACRAARTPSPSLPTPQQGTERSQRIPSPSQHPQVPYRSPKPHSRPPSPIPPGIQAPTCCPRMATPPGPPHPCPAPGSAHCQGGMGVTEGLPPGTTAPLPMLPPHSPAQEPGGTIRCQRISWSSTINNPGAPGTPGAWEGAGEVGCPQGAPTFGAADPKSARWVQELGGSHGSLGWGCALRGGGVPNIQGHPQDPHVVSPGLGVHLGHQAGPHWDDAEPCVPHAMARGGDAPGGKPRVAFPFQPLQLLVCPPGQEAGPLPAVFSMSGAQDMLPWPGKHQSLHGDAELRDMGDQGGGRMPEPPKAPRFNTSTEPRAPLPAVLDARGTGTPPTAAPLTCPRRSP